MIAQETIPGLNNWQGIEFWYHCSTAKHVPKYSPSPTKAQPSIQRGCGQGSTEEIPDDYACPEGRHGSL
jgi:hypothetical protein